MLAHRMRRWPSIRPALVYCLVFVGSAGDVQYTEIDGAVLYPEAGITDVENAEMDEDYRSVDAGGGGEECYTSTIQSVYILLYIHMKR